MHGPTHGTFRAKVAYVPRGPLNLSQKIKPSPDEQKVWSTSHSEDTTHKQASPPGLVEESANARETNGTTRIATPQSIEIVRLPTAKSIAATPVTQKRNLMRGVSDTFKSLTPRQKFIMKAILIAAAVLAVCTVCIVTPVMVLVMNKSTAQSSLTNITASVCSSATCIGGETPYQTSSQIILYPFDGSFTDLTGSATGVAFSNSSFSNSFSAACYIGTQSLQLNWGASPQYVQIPFINLGQRSFTIEVWLQIFSVNLTTDYGIFGQCDLSNNCLSLSLRNGRFALSFDAMNPNSTVLLGATINSINSWTHLAVVYDATFLQQRIYVNGQIDAMSRGIVQPFAVTSSSSVTTIGRTITAAFGVTNFIGRMDHFMIAPGTVRTACQIYNDATLTAYYPFNSVGTWSDYSVNLFNGVLGSITTISVAPRDQAIYFGTSNSYFQSPSFTSVSVTNNPFSMALWINPASPTSGGSIIHISQWPNGLGTNCYDLLALASSGSLVVQLLTSPPSVSSYQGPDIPAHVWTYIVVMYSLSNGVRIYMNGQLASISSGVGSLGFTASNLPQYITLGNYSPFGAATPFNCRNGTIPYVPGAFIGGMDEFRLYNRELTNQEICVLANM